MGAPIITREKLRIYERFHGDVDGFARGGTPSEKSVIADEEWRLIDEILQTLTIVQSGLASAEFTTGTLARLVKIAPDESVAERLRQISKPKS